MKQGVLAVAIIVPSKRSINSSIVKKLIEDALDGPFRNHILSIPEDETIVSSNKFWQDLYKYLDLLPNINPLNHTILKPDIDRNISSLHFAQSTYLTPLRPVDREVYTIRINTWKRHDLLLLSVAHHSSCLGTAQIQVIWKEAKEDIPQELLNNTKVVIEQHTQNTLNEHFHIQIPPPTLGIFTLDDDILITCAALDAAFHGWTKKPE